jgi:hypothetical protein
MQRLRYLGKGRKDRAILGDQRHAQLLGGGNELTVVGAAAAAAYQLQNMFCADPFLMGCKDQLGFLHQRNGSGKRQEITPQVTGEHIAELAAP